LRITLATEEHLDVVLGLIEDARSWLWTKDTDQWARPWPTEQERDDRVLKGLRGEKTWIVWDGAIPVATVTMTPRKNAAVWSPRKKAAFWSKRGSTANLAERAVFVHRLIIARKYAGTGLGADLIDWAGLRGKSLYGAKWIRIDVWRTNKGLHRYYRRQGFEPCGFCADRSYPSGALFQKPVSSIRRPRIARFIESPDQPPADSRGEEPRRLLTVH
jgi:GNAT superfamily N-acetyltransferase